MPKQNAVSLVATKPVKVRDILSGKAASVLRVKRPEIRMNTAYGVRAFSDEMILPVNFARNAAVLFMLITRSDGPITKNFGLM